MVKLGDVLRYANAKQARNFATHVVPHVVRPAQIIWNQAIGAIFLIIALPAVFKGWQLYRTLDTDPKSAFGLILSAIFVAFMVFFSVNSFLKARRIARRAPVVHS